MTEFGFLLVGLSAGEIVFCLVVVFVGAVLQGSIGTGLGLLAAPLLSLVDPAFVPAAIVVAVAPLTWGMAGRERSHIDRPGVTRAFLGRLPGNVIGAFVAARANSTVVAIIIGVTVLLAVGVSLTGFRFSPTNRNVVIAGFASGFTGTATGVGGPPIALTYQHSDPAVLRSSLATFFAFGGLVSMLLLALNGVLGARELKLAALMLPAVMAGWAVSTVTASRLPAPRVRPFVLLACAASAMALLFKVVV